MILFFLNELLLVTGVGFVLYILHFDKLALWLIKTLTRVVRRLALLTMVRFAIWVVRAIPPLLTPIPTRMLVLTPLLMLALAVQINLHGGGKPRHFGPMVGEPGKAVHTWIRVPDCANELDWVCVLEREYAIAYNRKQGVAYASK